MSRRGRAQLACVNTGGPSAPTRTYRANRLAVGMRISISRYLLGKLHFLPGAARIAGAINVGLAASTGAAAMYLTEAP